MTGAILFSLTVVLFYITIRLSMYHFDGTGIRVVGTVVHIRTEMRYRNSYYHTYHNYFPVVDFEYNGVHYEAESYVPCSERLCPFPGYHVEVEIGKGFDKVKILGVVDDGKGSGSSEIKRERI